MSRYRIHKQPLNAGWLNIKGRYRTLIGTGVKFGVRLN